MLYVFSGPHIVTVRMRALAFLDEYESRAETLLPEVCTPEVLRDRIGAQSLFHESEDALVTLIDMPSESTGALETVLSLAQELAESNNIFVLIERPLTASDVQEVRTHATKYFEFKEKSESVRFNVFTLSEALARRDKKSLWMLSGDALRAGLSSEEIVGTLLWQLKVMRLVSRTDSAREAGLKDFVYTKAKRGIAKFDQEELDRYSRELIALYHDARLGKRDMDIALERFVLAL